MEWMYHEPRRSPLAITMNAGPQIMSAITFVTAPKPLKLSAYFLTGVMIAVTAGVTITHTLATVLLNGVSLGDPSVGEGRWL